MVTYFAVKTVKNFIKAINHVLYAEFLFNKFLKSILDIYFLNNILILIKKYNNPNLLIIY